MKADVKPLVLDVDGTFLKTDMLFECLWAALGRDPLRTIGVALRHGLNPPKLKEELAEIADLRFDLLPVNPEMKALAEQNVAAGRRVAFASASHEPLVASLAEAHGLKVEIMGSDGQTNLKGSTKAERLVAEFGENGFDYAGDSRADIAVWQHADNALMVGTPDRAAQKLAAAGKNVAHYEGGWKLADLVKALRPHQWVKNVLLLLPMMAAHEFNLATLVPVLLGIVAFSAAASCIYIVNDLLDLEADRLHATKHRRPFASGAVPISVGMITCLLLGILAVCIGTALNAWFLLVIVIYMCLSLAYSLRWKRMRWVDIATLASLYTIRVVAGAAAGAVSISGAMLVFVFPVFLTLGCVKRLTELTLAETDDKLPGRGYGRGDRGDLLNMAGLGTVGALVTFFLYSLSEQAAELYPLRWLLWVATVPIALWLFRMVRLGYFGKQDYDPIVFAMRDKRGIGLLLITLSIVFYAAGLWQNWLSYLAH